MSKHIIDKVIKWANKRNIINGCEPIDQYIKLVEEFGELNQALASGYKIGRNNKSKEHLLFKDSIGDAMVVCIILLEQIGLELGCSCLTLLKADYNIHYKYYNTDIQVKYSRKIINLINGQIGRLGKLIKKSDYKNAHALLSVIFPNLLQLEVFSSNRYSLVHSYNEIKNRDGLI